MDRVCGLDVHKDSVFMCILTANGEKIEDVFGTLTPELDRLRDTLVSHGVGKVAMESTSIYWVPIWRILECDFDVKLVNPYFIRQLPGRKTDIKDAQWIATVLQKELIKGSYIPDSKIQELRQYSRRIFHLTRRKQQAESAIDLTLQRCNIRLSNYVSDIGCKSMRKVVNALICGETDSEVLALLVHKRIRNKHCHEVIKSSLTGIVSSSDRDMLKMSLEEVELYDRQLLECKEKMRIICEGHYGLRPRNDQSAGKIKGRKTLHGNKYLRVMLTQCAWGACRTQTSKFYSRYHTLKKRMNHNKALMANARKLLVVIWNLLAKKQPYMPFVN